MFLPEAQTAILSELADLALSSARDLHARQLAAETSEEASRLAFALHRVSRSIRQTLALQARLDREAKQADRDAAAERLTLEKAQTARRKAQVKGAVERLIWTEQESLDDPEDLIETLDSLLNAEAETEGFLSTDPQVQIATLCESIGLPSPLAGEGVVRSATDEGSHRDCNRPPSADSLARPLIRPGGHLLPQGEKEDDWRPSG